MQAIRTRYLHASNTRPASVAAACDLLRIRVEHDFNLADEINHRRAATRLCHRLGWRIVAGPGIYRGDHYWLVRDSEARDHD